MHIGFVTEEGGFAQFEGDPHKVSAVAGKEYWIIIDGDLPTIGEGEDKKVDRTDRDSWVWNPTRPADGIGGVA
jgi:hypothetical protein